MSVQARVGEITERIVERLGFDRGELFGEGPAIGHQPVLHDEQAVLIMADRLGARASPRFARDHNRQATAGQRFRKSADPVHSGNGIDVPVSAGFESVVKL